VSEVEVEVLGAESVALGPEETASLCRRALAAAVVGDGHVAVAFVGEDRIRELNRAHRGRDTPTDVLSFPVDGMDVAAGPRELGDIVVCPSHTTDLREAVVHGALHLAGLDHETDGGEMLALQAAVLRDARPAS